MGLDTIQGSDKKPNPARSICSTNRTTGPHPAKSLKQAVFSFLYLKKLKFQKYMSVLENFKNIPRSSYGGRHGSNVIFFFFKFAIKSLEKKKGLSPPQRATGPCRPPQGRQGPVARWGGDRGPSPYLSPGRHSPPFPLSFEPKNSGKKRGVRRRKAAKLCRIAYS